RTALGRQFLRAAIAQRDPGALEQAESLLPGDPVAALARSVFALPQDRLVPSTPSPAAALRQAARDLAAGPVGEPRRERVRGARGDRALRPLAQALLLAEAARGGDADAVAGLLGELDAWRGFRSGPPRFVLQALEALVAAQPGHPAWRCLPRWV